MAKQGDEIMAEKIEKVESIFQKAQFFQVKNILQERILLNVILEDGVEYTFSEVDKKIDNFMKKVVNKCHTVEEIMF